MLKRKNTVKRKSNNSAAFVLGSLFGGLVGAVAALWKTPQTGEQLREKITGLIPQMNGGSSTLDFSTVPAEVHPHDQRLALGTATGEPTAEGIGHVATTEELVRPPVIPVEA